MPNSGTDGNGYQDALKDLTQLSDLPIEEVIEKVQGHPWQVDTILDFYRIHRRFPNDD